MNNESITHSAQWIFDITKPVRIVQIILDEPGFRGVYIGWLFELLTENR